MGKFGWKDPTADEAVYNVMKEQCGKVNAPKKKKGIKVWHEQNPAKEFDEWLKKTLTHSED